MILSVSRRTDIPAFYSEWFFNRIKEGEVLVRNPMYPQKISRIALSPDVIDTIVFWTKDASPMLDRLDEINDYNYYFQYTINPYSTDLEPDVPNKNEKVIDSFIKLSNKIGKKRVIWRYDPILISNKYTVEYHIGYFAALMNRLSKHTDQCVFSFIDIYSKNVNTMNRLGVREPNTEEMHVLAEAFSNIAKKHGIKLSTCAEKIDLDKYGIKHASCIDNELIEELFDCTLRVTKDKQQRGVCGCVSSIDIGVYNTCTHGCAYCYANNVRAKTIQNSKMHNPKSPVLIGEVNQSDIITDRKMSSLIK